MLYIRNTVEVVFENCNVSMYSWAEQGTKQEFLKYLYCSLLKHNNILSEINNYYSVVRPYENTVGSVN